jgi:hypothetical protein
VNSEASEWPRRTAVNTARPYLKMLSRRYIKANREQCNRLSDEDKQKVQELVVAKRHQSMKRLVDRFAAEG